MTPRRHLSWLLAVTLTLGLSACSDDGDDGDDDAPPPAPDATVVDAGVVDAAPLGACSPEDASYTACGCGCCPGASPLDRCLDRDAGETLESVQAADEAAAMSPGCPMAGCGTPIVYRCCE